MNVTNRQFKVYKKLKKWLKNREFKMAMTHKNNHPAVIENEMYLKMGEEHTVKDSKISLDDAIDLAKKNNQHMSMLLKIFNMGKNEKEKKRFRESYMNH